MCDLGWVKLSGKGGQRTLIGLDEVECNSIQTDADTYSTWELIQCM